MKREKGDEKLIIISVAVMGLLQLRFEYDSSTIRARHATTGYEIFRALAYLRDRFEHSERISGRRVLHVDWQLNAHSFYFILI